MYGENYWSTTGGRLSKAFKRSMSALHLRLDREPRSKRSWRAKDRAAIQAEILTSAEVWLRSPDRVGAVWPRPRASLALDIHVFSQDSTSPRIDSICKWLLDELGGPDAGQVIYKDDRQVRWLFASKSVMPRIAKGGPHIYITAQTVANRIADVKLAMDLEPTWTTDEDARSPFLLDDIEVDHYADWLDGLDPETDDFQRSQHAMTLYKLRYQTQAMALEALDQLAPGLLKQFASDVTPLYSWVLSLIRQSPYAFDLGSIPKEGGDTLDFKTRTKLVMQERKRTYPRLFPLLPSVGVTLLYFRTGQGKDLDNLFRDLIPIVLDELEPPLIDRPYLPAHDDGEAASNDVQFIEAIALDNPPSGAVPGSAFLLLSNGWRHRSWWEDASSFVDGHPHDE